MKIGIIFPGYGQQYITMGKDLYDTDRLMQELFEQAAVVSNLNYVKLMFADSDAELAKIENAYGAIYLLECSLIAMLKEKGLCAEFVAGYGIGEYAAMYASGALSFEDGLYLLQKYASLMQQFSEQFQNYSVLHIPKGLSTQELQKLIDEDIAQGQRLYISAFNTDQDHFVVGTNAAIDYMMQVCEKMEIKKIKRYSYEAEFHSDIIAPVFDQLKMYFHKVVFKDLQTPLITNVDGAYITTGASAEAASLRRIVEPVLWNEVMEGFAGCDIILSVGPGDQLIKWAEKMYPDKKIMQVLKIEDIQAVAEIIAQEDQPCSNLLDLQEAGATLHDIDEMNELLADEEEDEDDELEEIEDEIKELSDEE